MKFQVANISCQNCANLIKNTLSDEFGAIDIDLGKQPRELNVQITQDKIDKFKTELSKLGFDIIKEI